MQELIAKVRRENKQQECTRALWIHYDRAGERRMIDYYLHKKCPLTSPTPRQQENVRCSGCVWLDTDCHKCVFGLHYPFSITIKEMLERIRKVDGAQQQGLSQVFRRFIE